MSIFMTRIYPTLGFYVRTSDPEFLQNSPERQGAREYHFANGMFDTEWVPEIDQEICKAALDKLAANPGPSGVFKYEDKIGMFRCEVCERPFRTAPALNGHRSAHKSKEQIDEESTREGAIPVNQ